MKVTEILPDATTMALDIVGADECASTALYWTRRGIERDRSVVGKLLAEAAREGKASGFLRRVREILAALEERDEAPTSDPVTRRDAGRAISLEESLQAACAAYDGLVEAQGAPGGVLGAQTRGGGTVGQELAEAVSHLNRAKAAMGAAAGCAG